MIANPIPLANPPSFFDRTMRYYGRLKTNVGEGVEKGAIVGMTCSLAFAAYGGTLAVLNTADTYFNGESRWDCTLEKHRDLDLCRDAKQVGGAVIAVMLITPILAGVVLGGISGVAKTILQ